MKINYEYKKNESIWCDRMVKQNFVFILFVVVVVYVYLKNVEKVCKLVILSSFNIEGESCEEFCGLGEVCFVVQMCVVNFWVEYCKGSLDLGSLEWWMLRGFFQSSLG